MAGLIVLGIVVAFGLGWVCRPLYEIHVAWRFMQGLGSTQKEGTE